MARLSSRITEDGLVTIPDEIQEKLGVRPGLTIEWEEEGDRVIVKPGKTYTFEEIHKALFPNGPPAPRTVEEMDDAIGEHLKRKHRRR